MSRLKQNVSIDVKKNRVLCVNQIIVSLCKSNIIYRTSDINVKYPIQRIKSNVSIFSIYLSNCYIFYLPARLISIPVKCGSVLITHDKKPPGSPQPGGEREVTGRAKSPASHLSFNSGLKAQKKPQDRKKNKKNKPVVDIPPTPKESF